MDPDSNRDMPELINFIKVNGYDLEKVEYNPRSGGNARAIFSKMTHINDDGNDINDATITISIDFDTRFDYKNIAWLEEEQTREDILDKAEDFIQQLMDETYDDRGVGVGKGKRNKGKKKRKTRKIKKH
jgi:hypothetical protein